MPAPFVCTQFLDQYEPSPSLEGEFHELPMLPGCLPGNQAKLLAELLGVPAEAQVTCSPTEQLVVDGSARRLLCSSNEKQAWRSPESAQRAHGVPQEAQEARAQEPSDACSQMLPADRAVPTRKRKVDDEDVGSASWLPTAGGWAESRPAPSRGPHVNITAEVGGRQAGLVQPNTSSKRRKQCPELRPQGLQQQQQQAVGPRSAESAGAACSGGDHAAGREAGAQLKCPGTQSASRPPGRIIATQVHGSIARQHPGSSLRPAAAGQQQPALEAAAASPGGTQRRTSAGLATPSEITVQEQVADCGSFVRAMDGC